MMGWGPQFSQFFCIFSVIRVDTVALPGFSYYSVWGCGICSWVQTPPPPPWTLWGRWECVWCSSDSTVFTFSLQHLNRLQGLQQQVYVWKESATGAWTCMVQEPGTSVNSESIVYSNALNSQDNTMVLSLALLYRWGNWGPEMSVNLPEFTQLVNDGARTWTQAAWSG